jgi:hypothetical protein
MAAISQKINGLIGGVSQQPDTIKSSSQLRVCDNYYPDVATGLMKRPGLQAINRLPNATADGTWFTIFRDDQEKYLVEFTKDGALRIWNAETGVEQTVNPILPEATAYAVHEEQRDLQILQINDFIFVLNRAISVETSTDESIAQNPYAFVSINTVAYSSTYTITLDGTPFVYATTTTATNQLNVADIVTNLVNSINGNPLYVATGLGNHIHIRRLDNTDFTIDAKGGNTGTAIEAFQSAVTVVGQLPKQFINNLKIKVAASADTGADDYWVIFKTNNNAATGVGTWEETIAPETTLKLDEETMPHVIIREANGAFTYRQLDEASALASIGNTSVPGIPTSVGVSSAISGGHVVDEQFNVIGGSGTGLRLKVTKIKNITAVSNFLASNPSSFVQRILVPVAIFGGTLYRYDYYWYSVGVLVAITANTNPLTIGNIVRTINTAFESIGGSSRAGYQQVTTTIGAIDGVIIAQAGQNYVSSEFVSNTQGDSFNILATNTSALSGDESRLEFWKPREVGDNETNPLPSFVGFPVDSISFFKNRIVFTSRQNVICSQAGDYFNFFASTVITIVDNDPIDLSAGSTKPIKLTEALATSSGLLLFGDNGQYILQTTTESFSPKTAEINLLANYSLFENVSPIDIGNSVLFMEENAKSSAVYEMAVSANIGGKPTIIELTRLIPTYIPSAIYQFKASQAANTVALVSRQDPTEIYLYRYFQNGDTRISGWFRWTTPHPVEALDFDQDILYIVTKNDDNYLLSKVSLITDTPSDSILFEGEYLDVRLDYFDYNPLLIYDSIENETHVCFKDGFETTDIQPVLIYLDPAEAGAFEEQQMQSDLTLNVGQRYFLTVPGNRTTSRFALGFKYEAIAQLPAFYVVKDEARALKDTVNVPRISKLKVNSYNSGPYRAVIRASGRDEFSLQLPQITANNYLTNHIPIIRNAQSTIPVMAKGDQFEFELIADSPFQTAFTSIDWEGTYDNKGIRSV